MIAEERRVATLLAIPTEDTHTEILATFGEESRGHHHLESLAIAAQGDAWRRGHTEATAAAASATRGRGASSDHEVAATGDRGQDKALEDTAPGRLAKLLSTNALPRWLARLQVELASLFPAPLKCRCLLAAACGRSPHQ